jgi:hypothetical protein
MSSPIKIRTALVLAGAASLLLSVRVSRPLRERDTPPFNFADGRLVDQSGVCCTGTSFTHPSKSSRLGLPTLPLDKHQLNALHLALVGKEC